METEPRMPGEPQSSSFPSWAMPVMMGVIALLVVSNGYTLLQLLKSNELVPGPNPVVQKPEVDTAVPPVVVDTPEQPVEVIPQEPKPLDVVTDKTMVTVTWDKEPVLLSAYPTSLKSGGEKFSLSVFHRAGTVASGTYAGKSVYLLHYIPAPEWGGVEMGGPVTTFFRVIETTPKLLAVGVADIPNELRDVLAAAPDMSVSGLTSPASIAIPQSIATLKRTEHEGNVFYAVQPHNLASTYGDAVAAFSADGVTVYRNATESSECYFVRIADGTVVWYDMITELFPKSFDPTLRAPGVLQSTWLDGTKNTKGYAPFSMSGCGTSVCYDYVPTLKIEQLQKTGTLPSGAAVYELKTDVKREPKDEKGMLEDAYAMLYGEPKITYAEFLKNHPLVFWQSPFGGFVRLLNETYMPAVECGKPVIYLYPTEPMHVDVEVAPTGGFSVTEPAYNDGWSVWADPSGELVNDADKQTYPYLFWEGNGLSYTRPSQGFVVAKADVRSFLVKSLTAQGLIAKEYNEFIEFWLPKMQAKPYYFVTFVPQEQFNTLAPLNITPKPDTVIRVFMDYQGLDQPMSVQPQQLSAPLREGFTVIEWGGALHQ